MLYKNDQNGRIFLLAFVIFMGLLTSCESLVPDEKAGWLLTNLRIDAEQYRPMASHVMLRSDTAYIHHWAIGRKDTMAFFVRNDTLHVDTQKYGPGQYHFFSDRIEYRKPYTLYLQRPIKTSLGMSRVDLRNILYGGTWTSELGQWRFDEGGKVMFRALDDLLAQEYCWSLYEVNDALFLLIHGNHQECEVINFPLFQILQAKEGLLSLYSWENTVGQSFRMKKVNIQGHWKLDSFQLCSRQMYFNNPMDHYYYKGTRLKGGHYILKKALEESYHPPVDGFTGTLMIQFVVSCEGVAGRFTMYAMDENYKRVSLPQTEAESLMKITRAQGPWIPGAQGEPKRFVDTYYFIGYKLRDGKVVDILP